MVNKIAQQTDAAVTTDAVETMLVTVARGRSIQVADRLYGPGEEVAIPKIDYAHISAGGFVAIPDEPPIIRTLPQGKDNPGNIGMQITLEGSPGSLRLK